MNSFTRINNIEIVHELKNLSYDDICIQNTVCGNIKNIEKKNMKKLLFQHCVIDDINLVIVSNRYIKYVFKDCLFSSKNLFLNNDNKIEIFLNSNNIKDDKCIIENFVFLPGVYHSLPISELVGDLILTTTNKNSKHKIIAININTGIMEFTFDDFKLSDSDIKKIQNEYFRPSYMISEITKSIQYINTEYLNRCVENL